MGRKPSAKKEIETAEIASFDKIKNDNVLKYIKLDLKCKSANQKTFVNSIKEKDITICTGPPGSGKTYLTCYQFLELLKNNPQYEKIVLVKSVTTLQGEEIGFLKGTMQEKMEPFIYPFIQNFGKIIGKLNVDKLRELEIVEELPIAYMRGVNIDNALIVIDEVQNISVGNIRTILTRLGENSKMVLLGDVLQTDNKLKKKNALEYMLKYFKGNSFGVIEFTEDDIVRHPLIKEIEKIFNENPY